MEIQLQPPTLPYAFTPEDDLICSTLRDSATRVTVEAEHDFEAAVGYDRRLAVVLSLEGFAHKTRAILGEGISAALHGRVEEILSDTIFATSIRLIEQLDGTARFADTDPSEGFRLFDEEEI
mgnify:CR=1 FL=1